MPDDPGQPLVELWRRLVAALRDEARHDPSQTKRADHIQHEVLDRVSAASAPPLLWLDQAEAMLAWRTLVAEDESQQKAMLRWAALQKQCEWLRQRIEIEEQSAHARFFGLFPPSKEQQALFSDLKVYLTDCDDAFKQISREQTEKNAHRDSGASLQRTIEEFLSNLSSEWAPANAARYFATGCGHQIPAVRNQLETRADDWRASLAMGMPELADEECNRLLLLRGIVENAPDPTGLAELCSGLFPTEGLQVEIASDPNQPREWFEAPREADVAKPAVERLGLIVRHGANAWLGFPLARLVLPLPAPPGFNDLRELLDPPKSDAEAALWNRVHDWRNAAMNGSLEMAVVQFFVDFWGPLGDALRQEQPEIAAEVARVLAELLPRDHKLYLFHPVAFQDHPDGWLQRVPGFNMVTGKVRRIIRPGLQDEHHQLRVPALVEVE